MNQRTITQLGRGFIALVCGITLVASVRSTQGASFPGTLTWQLQMPIPGGVEGAAGGVIGSKLYVSHGLRAAGDSADLSIYDIPTDTWSTGPTAAVMRAEMAGGVADGKVYAIGGRTPTAAVEAFDPVANTWTTVASLSRPRGGLGGASVGGLIYAVGGRDGPQFGFGTILGTNEVYNPMTNTWTLRAPMPIPLSDVYATVGFDGKVYVLGGASGPSTVTGAVQIYDPVSDTWSKGAPMPTPRAAAMAGVVCGQIVVFGGFDGLNNLDVTEIYDPADDTWTSGPAMLSPASEMAQGPTQTANVIFAVGSGIFGVHDDIVQALVAQCNPDCSAAVASPSQLWPPNHQFVDVAVNGVTDPDGDAVTITITGITQDEPINGLGDGNTCPDATGVGDAVASLRAERSGKGDGRVYHVSFTATDDLGGQCQGTVAVCVPHDQGQGHTCVDEGPLFDSTGPCN